MSTPKTPALKQTKEYRLFVADETNRLPRKTKKITASMKQWGFLPAHPIACVPNGARMTIRDGQHRFYCARELGIPLYYVCAEAYTGVSIPELNGATAGAWAPIDYVTSFCNQGKPEYAKLRAFCEDNGVPVSIGARLLSGSASGGLMDNVREGRFTVRDAEFATRAIAVVLAAKPHFKYYSHNIFIQAIGSALRVEGVTSALLTEKISKYPQLLRHGGNVEGFLEVLEDLCNHHSKSRIALKFLAMEGAKARQLRGNPRKPA